MFVNDRSCQDPLSKWTKLSRKRRQQRTLRQIPHPDPMLLAVMALSIASVWPTNRVYSCLENRFSVFISVANIEGWEMDF